MPESMRETLEATFKDIEDREEHPEPKEESEAPEVEHDEPETSNEPAEPEIPAEPNEKIEVKAAEKPAEKTSVKPQAKPQEKRDTSLANPPVTWTAKAKSQWAAIPDDVKREIRKREQDALNGITQYKEQATFGEKLNKTIQPYQAFLKARGATPERVVEDALNLSYSLANGTPQQRGDILRKIAKQYGADLNASQEQEAVNPVLQPLLSKIENLERTLQHSKESEQQRQTQTLEQQVSSFAAETDDTGTLKYPYFNELRGLMGAIIESGHAAQLDEAYALAAKAHPEISVLVQSEQTLRKQERDGARVEKARRNDQVNFSRKPTSPMKNAAPHGTMRETIEATFNRMQSA